MKEAFFAELGMIKEMYNKDCRHLSDEQFMKNYGQAKSAMAITAECGGFNKICSAMIRGEEVAEGTNQAYQDAVTNKAEAMELLNSSCDELSAAVAGLADDDLNTEIQAPWGEPITKINLARMCPWHMTYHDGQLNYIQMMEGDMDVHWMEE